MTDDIVTRLRADDCFEFPSCDDVKQEAADEIERLRKLATTWNICAKRLVESREGEEYEKALAFYLDCQRLAKEAYRA